MRNTYNFIKFTGSAYEYKSISEYPTQDEMSLVNILNKKGYSRIGRTIYSVVNETSYNINNPIKEVEIYEKDKELSIDVVPAADIDRFDAIESKIVGNVEFNLLSEENADILETFYNNYNIKANKYNVPEILEELEKVGFELDDNFDANKNNFVEFTLQRNISKGENGFEIILTVCDQLNGLTPVAKLVLQRFGYENPQTAYTNKLNGKGSFRIERI